ncbi:MAG: glyoxylase-like metal-dependent hydrolase (beta-lactamase superfamily II) [Paracoccaceae bacterium]|jgi:glyoxylase-like metal-dependent hydrolase (beta-lactamase superfamily II)
MKRNKKIALSGLAAFVVAIAAIMGPIAARMPFAQAERVSDGLLTGVDAGGSFAWIIPTTSGVVLIDAGWDAEATQIRDELGERKVLAVFLTHAHFDHTGGLAAFPDAPVYVGLGEEALLMGDTMPQGWMARISTKMMAPPPPTGANVIVTTDGQNIEIDGITVRAIHTPGHTPGSAMYIWNNTLFSGDSIVGRGDHVNEIPKAMTDDYDQIHSSIAKVMQYKFDDMADGHVGLHKGIRDQVKAYVAGQ